MILHNPLHAALSSNTQYLQITADNKDLLTSQNGTKFFDVRNSVVEGHLGEDLAVMQVNSGVDAFQLSVSGSHLIVRQNDNPGTADWPATFYTVMNQGDTAAAATKLATSRIFPAVNLAGTSGASFDGSANLSALGVTGTLPIGHGGTGSTTAAAARTALGITPANIGALPTAYTTISSSNKDTLTSLRGTQFFNVQSSTEVEGHSGEDLCILQLDSGNDSFQLGISSKHLIVRQNDSPGSAAWPTTFTQVMNKGDTADAATKLSTARNINGMSVDGTANRFNYGTCSTAATTVEKAVTCAGFALATGAEITVKFTVTNSATSPTLNVNGTGAHPIYYRNAAITPAYLAANRTYTFRYNGTQYELVGDIDTNTQVAASSTTPKAPAASAAVGSETKYARGDHVHPLQTSVSGNAGTATKLATARSLKTNLGSTDAVTFDGSAAQDSIPITGTLAVSHGGTGSTTAAAARTALGITAANLGAVAKAGDTMTGNLTMSGATQAIKYASGTRTGSPITFYAGDVNGSGIVIGDGGRTIIGAGESASALRTALGTTAADEGKEEMHIASDGPVYIHTNANTIADRKTVTINTSGNITAPGGFTGSLSGKATSAGTADAATKLSTARNINGMSVDGTANRFNYGTCSTAATTVEKAVTCAGFALATGAEITVKFTVTNSATSPTLNVNGTGAHPIYYRNAAITPAYLAANRTYTFRYNGTQYELVGDIDTNTQVAASSTTPKAPAASAAVGSETKYARGDHVHPVQTSVSGNAGTATKLAAPRSLKTNLGSTTAVTFDGSAAQDSIPITGTLAVSHGGTGVTTADGLRDLVNTYNGAKGTDEKTQVIAEFAKTKDNTTRTVYLLINGSGEFLQIFRTSSTYGNVVIYSGYGDKVNMMSLHNGTWTGPTPIYPIKIPTSLPANGGTASNVSGTVAISHGGTGATTLQAAQTALGITPYYGIVTSNGTLAESDAVLKSIVKDAVSKGEHVRTFIWRDIPGNSRFGGGDSCVIGMFTNGESYASFLGFSYLSTGGRVVSVSVHNGSVVSLRLDPIIQSAQPTYEEGRIWIKI